MMMSKDPSNYLIQPIEEMEENSEWVLNQVFCNDLIWRKIAHHLPVSDLKIARQTCKLFLDRINVTPRLLKNLTLVISDETRTEGVIRETKLEWKNAQILVNQLSSSEIICLTTVLNSCESLMLHDGDGEIMSFENRSTNIDILFHLPNLTSLTLHLDIFRHLFPFVKYSTVFRKLKYFSITSTPKIFRPRGSLEIENYQRLAENFQELANVSITTLKSLELSNFVRKSAPESLLKLFESNAATLNKIVTPFISGMEKLMFSSLRELHVTFYGSAESVKCVEWLGSLSSLKTIHCHLVKGGMESTILELISNRFPNLVDLHLSGFEWFGAEDWNFLKEAKSLKTFTFIGGRRNWERPRNKTADTILTNLPNSMEKISLGYFKCTNWDQLSRFRHLTKLELENAELNDNVLQSICAKCVKIQILKIGDCNEVTDFGLTGFQSNGFYSGTSLKNLKGMKELHIRNCPVITESGLYLAVRFKELKIFTCISMRGEHCQYFTPHTNTT